MSNRTEAQAREGLANLTRLRQLIAEAQRPPLNVLMARLKRSFTPAQMRAWRAGK